jgi:DNA polymerase-1
LAQRLQVTVEGATEFMNLYFNQLPNVARWMEKQKALVKRQGYVVSVFGRKRRLPLALSDKYGDISRAERQAMNSPIQSGAADYTYIGLIRLRRAILREHLEGKIVHTVHDCGLADTPKVEVPQMVELFHEAFETPVKAMPISMQIDVEINKRWGQNNESRLQEVFDKVGLKMAA